MIAKRDGKALLAIRAYQWHVLGCLLATRRRYTACHQLIGPVEKEHFCGFGFGLIFCGGLGL
jgi:hypothetical protein